MPSALEQRLQPIAVALVRDLRVLFIQECGARVSPATIERMIGMCMASLVEGAIEAELALERGQPPLHHKSVKPPPAPPATETDHDPEWDREKSTDPQRLSLRRRNKH